MTSASTTRLRSHHAPCFTVLTAIALLVCSLQSASATTIYSANSEPTSGAIFSNNLMPGGNDVRGERRVGSSTTNNVAINVVHFFELPDPSVANNYDFTSELTYGGADGVPAFEVDAYGLGWVSTPNLDQSWFFEGNNDTSTRASYGTGAAGSVVKLGDGIITSSTPTGRLETGPEPGIKAFVQSLYTDDATAGDYAVVRFNANVDTATINGVGYNLGVDTKGAGGDFNFATVRAGNLPVAADSFGASTDTINTTLNLTDATGYGFATAGWNTPPPSLRGTLIEPTTPMSYSANGVDVDGGPTAVRFSGANSGSSQNNNPFRRELAAPMTDDIYVRYLIREENGFDDNDFIVLWLDDNDAGDTDPHIDGAAYLGIGGDAITGLNGDSAFARINNMGQQSVSLGDLVEGEDYMLVGRLFKEGGNQYNRLAFWVNPDADDFDNPDGIVMLGSNPNLTQVTHVGLRTGANTETGDSYLFDALAIGTSFEQVVGELAAVPEPSTVVLIGLGTLLLGGVRRRR